MFFSEIVFNALQVDSLVNQWICYECFNSRIQWMVTQYCTLWVSILQPLSHRPKRAFLNLPSNRFLWSKPLYLSVGQTEAPVATSLSCVCVHLWQWSYGTKTKAWCVKWDVAAMHVCCSLVNSRFEQHQPSVEHKSNQTAFDSSLQQCKSCTTS